jgi:hypothetical protein
VRPERMLMHSPPPPPGRALSRCTGARPVIHPMVYRSSTGSCTGSQLEVAAPPPLPLPLPCTDPHPIFHPMMYLCSTGSCCELRPTHLASGSEQPRAPILGDFGRVGSVLGSFCPCDAVCSGFRVAGGFRVYVKGHVAHTIQTDSPIRLVPHPAANPPKMLLGSRNPLGLA